MGSRSVPNMNDLPETELEQGEQRTLWSLHTTKPEPIKIEARVNKVPLVMKRDTRANV